MAGLAGAVFALVFLGLMSRGSIERLTFGDGVLYRAVASDLDADASSVDPIVGASGPALRHGRIGLPALIWLLSGGQEAAMPFVQPLIMVLCAAGIAMVSVALLPGSTPIFGLAPFIAVGLTASLAGGFAEPLAVFLSLLGVLAIERDHRWGAAAALAGAIFARENSIVVVVGVVAWLVLQPRFRDAAAVATAVVPVAAWHMIVDARFGHLPLRDPWLIDTGALGVPFLAAGRALGQVSPAGIALIVVHLGLALVALRLWRRSPLWAVAAVAGPAALSVGEFSWRYIGDATRLSAFLEVFVILAVLRMFLEHSADGDAIDATSQVESPPVGQLVAR